MPPGTGALNETSDISGFVLRTQLPVTPGGVVTINIIIIKKKYWPEHRQKCTE